MLSVKLTCSLLLSLFEFGYHSNTDSQEEVGVSVYVEEEPWLIRFKDVVAGFLFIPNSKDTQNNYSETKLFKTLQLIVAIHGSEEMAQFMHIEPKFMT